MVENKNRCTDVTHTLGKARVASHARDKSHTMPETQTPTRQVTEADAADWRSPCEGVKFSSLLSLILGQITSPV